MAEPVCIRPSCQIMEGDPAVSTWERPAQCPPMFEIGDVDELQATAARTPRMTEGNARFMGTSCRGRLHTDPRSAHYYHRQCWWFPICIDGSRTRRDKGSEAPHVPNSAEDPPTSRTSGFLARGDLPSLRVELPSPLGRRG